MVKLGDIQKWLEEKAPLYLQESYDNSGLLVGDIDREITSVALCLDLDEQNLRRAVREKRDLIIVHHPPVFKAIKTFHSGTREGRLLYTAVKEDVAVYACHTNYDGAAGGLTDRLCSLLGLMDIKPLKGWEDQGKEHLLPEEKRLASGWGRVGNLTSPKVTDVFLKQVRELLNTSFLRTAGKKPESIRRLGVYNGSYDRAILPYLLKEKVDALLTGDLKYHDAQELEQKGLFAVDGGHFPTESLFSRELARELAHSFPMLKVEAYEGKDVFTLETDSLVSAHELFNRIHDLARAQFKQIKSIRPCSLIFPPGNYIRLNGRHYKQSYGIPVIQVEKAGDMGFNLDGVFFEFFIPREEVVNLDLEWFSQYTLELYGGENCTLDFYSPGDTLEAVTNKVYNSTEEHIGISVYLPYGRDDYWEEFLLASSRIYPD